MSLFATGAESDTLSSTESLDHGGSVQKPKIFQNHSKLNELGNSRMASLTPSLKKNEAEVTLELREQLESFKRSIDKKDMEIDCLRHQLQFTEASLTALGTSIQRLENQTMKGDHSSNFSDLEASHSRLFTLCETQRERISQLESLLSLDAYKTRQEPNENEISNSRHISIKCSESSSKQELLLIIKRLKRRLRQRESELNLYKDVRLYHVENSARIRSLEEENASLKSTLSKLQESNEKDTKSKQGPPLQASHLSRVYDYKDCLSFTHEKSTQTDIQANNTNHCHCNHCWNFLPIQFVQQIEDEWRSRVDTEIQRQQFLIAHFEKVIQRMHEKTELQMTSFLYEDI